jgi:hypothetical protein
MNITAEAIEHLKQNPTTMAAIAAKLNRSLSTLQTWFYRSPEKFADPVPLEIIAKSMGKKKSEIVEPEKTEA